ncbi:hypothetical protein EG856_01465 [Mycoplasmopsis phocirhinis]|uniref:Uncharacterized protein n=1 Tax=Mycoplasmopsis phocirhinis TaxID=142650 RepID=A0A4P6MNZ7_9BACT|nr:hypothetical protein [Mycoplasmopsis phocirhinis]QBF34590.1 hypothetical protein EG856_01465 [Mycoplasmopsis phocirhinis]
MVEQISEGNFDENKTEIFDSRLEQNLYDFLNQKITQKNKPKAGVAIMFNVFDSNKIIDIFKKIFHIDNLDEEIQTNKRFSFALYFDKDLNLINELTFFTISGYILDKEIIPKQDKFLEYEKENKQLIKQIFTNEQNLHPRFFFNKAFTEILKYLT